MTFSGGIIVETGTGTPASSTGIGPQVNSLGASGTDGALTNNAGDHRDLRSVRQVRPDRVKGALTTFVQDAENYVQGRS